MSSNSKWKGILFQSLTILLNWFIFYKENREYQMIEMIISFVQISYSMKFIKILNDLSLKCKMVIMK